MEKLNALLAEARRYMDQMTRRERLMVMAAGGTFVLFVSSIVLTTISHSINRHEISIEEKSGNLQKIAVYAQSFAQGERERKNLQMKLSGPPVQLMSELSSLAGKRELNIGAMNDRGEHKVDLVEEKLVELQINDASIDKLTELLNDIEHDPKIIKVRKLRLRRTGPTADTINAVMTVGSYQLLKG